MPFIRLTLIERRRVLTLLACLVLAIAAWLFMALSNKHDYIAKTVITYRNFPQKKAFHPLQSDTVDLRVQGTGWQLLFARFRINPQSISVSLRQLNTRDYNVFADQLENINKQLGSLQKVISIKPDTLYFDFTKRSVKRVPIVLVQKIGFAKQYGISNDILLTPKYVTLSGPQEELNKIKNWSTDTLKMLDVQSSISSRILMQNSRLKNVNIFPSSVEVKVPVDEFTEKTVEVPLKILNNKNYYSFKLFPKKVKVTFVVALSNYAQVDESFIQASVDANEWQNLGHNQFTVKITEFPDYCKLIGVSPSKIDFIIDR